MTWVQHKAAEIYAPSACIHNNHTREDVPIPPQCYAKELNGAQEDAEISIRMFTVAFYAMKK